MTYWPRHRPQLTGISTASVDCGVRATQMAIDDASRGKLVPGVARIRKAMDDQDTTNAGDWEVAIDTLGAPHEVRAVQTDVPRKVEEHLKAGMGAILAVDYGKLRQLAPRKTGSETFAGYHAIFVKGWKKGDQVRSFDALLDGRYKGCPDGPVWLPWRKLRTSALEVGRREAQADRIYAVLVYPRDKVGGIEIPPDEEPMSLTDILSDLYELRDEAPNTALAISRLIAGLEAIIGTGNPEADQDTQVSEGVRP